MGSPQKSQIARSGFVFNTTASARKLTIEQLAAKAQVYWTYISGLENDLRKDPGLSVIQRVAAALDVSPSELIDNLVTVPPKRGRRTPEAKKG